MADPDTMKSFKGSEICKQQQRKKPTAYDREKKAENTAESKLIKKMAFMVRSPLHRGRSSYTVYTRTFLTHKVFLKPVRKILTEVK